MVSEICAKEHRISSTRAAGTRDEEELMGESDSCPTVGVEEEVGGINGTVRRKRKRNYPPPLLPGGRVLPWAVGSTLSLQRKAERMGNTDKETRERAFRDRKEALTESTCHYCSEVATTIRQGAAVCWQHAISLRGVGWA